MCVVIRLIAVDFCVCTCRHMRGKFMFRWQYSHEFMFWWSTALHIPWFPVCPQQEFIHPWQMSPLYYAREWKYQVSQKGSFWENGHFVKKTLFQLFSLQLLEQKFGFGFSMLGFKPVRIADDLVQCFPEINELHGFACAWSQYLSL